VLNRSKAVSWFTGCSQFTHSQWTPPTEWCQQTTQNTRDAVCACSSGFCLFKKKKFSFDKSANRKVIQRLVGIIPKKITCNITSIIDDCPGSRIFVNTRIIILLVSSQKIVLEILESVSLALHSFGRICHSKPQHYICWNIASISSFISCYLKGSFWLVFWMVSITPDFQNDDISETCVIFFVMWLYILGTLIWSPYHIYSTECGFLLHSEDRSITFLRDTVACKKVKAGLTK
jgi:hypothetical protein